MIQDNEASFADRHIGPGTSDVERMLSDIGESSLDDFVRKVVPDTIYKAESLALKPGCSEQEALSELRQLADQNTVLISMIGQGYYNCYLPEVIRRNVMESPSWYTAYTPYQPEIAQGRLEVLFNFQTMITELTAMDIANASLLDEGTAAAEAMAMCHRVLRGKRNILKVSCNCHPQTIDVVKTRAEPLGIVVDVCDDSDMQSVDEDVFAILLQYPGTDGSVSDYSAEVESAHQAGALAIFAADLLALTLLKPPGQMGADIVIGSAQRFGIPMGFGGPHAGFMATTDKHKRSMPGRLIGQSVDTAGRAAYRLALQTREQHIRREKATSNICTAQALLAILATLYACYHGPEGLRAIALRVQSLTSRLAALLSLNGIEMLSNGGFDTLRVACDVDDVMAKSVAIGINLRAFDEHSIGLSLDETSTESDVLSIASILCGKPLSDLPPASELQTKAALRTDQFLTQPCFHRYRSETEMMRYLRRLADCDIALDRAMIPLGSCTMKLNAAAEMAPVSWPEFSNLHPFVPRDQSVGYRKMIAEVEDMLCACTGYDAISLQPNAGSQGEYAGLLAISRYHLSRGDTDRNVCLIPSSAHGTNPASAQMAGMSVVVVGCDTSGNIDMVDLQEKLDKFEGKVAAIMITYPSTHGVFEAEVRDVCKRVHDAGGQVYIDGANLNAMVGIAEPGQFGGDVSHLNLHKTFCIPHGGGGPGIGPVGVGKHLEPFLPGHREWGDATIAVSSAPWGSAMILPITWMYIRMMGAAGLERATKTAILNANYLAKRLSTSYPVLYRSSNGFVAHECILDTRPLKDEVGITVDDIAKRLMDYGFHAPTMSFPVPGTLMIEPTESESLEEMDRFIDAMLSIRAEISAVESGQYTREDNPLVHAPHTAEVLLQDDWDHTYSRQVAAYPTGDLAPAAKYWPPVGRIDNVYGDKNLICSCPPLSDYTEADHEEGVGLKTTSPDLAVG